MFLIIKPLFTLLLTAVLFLTTPIAIAEDTAVDTYQGIEIVVNINSADAEELDQLLIGVGPSKAKAIVEYRDQNGAFTKAEDLMLVKGIGPSLFNKNQPRIRL
ncbi:ComEA family DNA-binding protein [Aliivibrio kagoshimensis]|uniref:ComEA family DNA-binding protein n=1 Tax=Aliivibrio kagoshimensis TaxID=2910230 RepID=UPI003D0D5827